MTEHLWEVDGLKQSVFLLPRITVKNEDNTVD